MIPIVAEALIIESVTELSAIGGVWADMGAVRDVASLRGVRRVDFDAAMVRLVVKGIMITTPEDNQKTINATDNYNGVSVGGIVHHLATLG